MRANPGSEYLQWINSRTPARFNLTASGVLPCLPGELNTDAETIEINGPGLYSTELLLQSIAGHCGVQEESVVAAYGASMANFVAMAAIIQPGDEVLIEHPAYEPLLAVARYLGAQTKRFPRGEPLSNFVSSRTRLIVVTNLHNPSCARLTDSELDEISEAALGVGARVLVDEVYLQCVFGDATSAVHRGKHFVCTGSLTKAYGLSGLRCGWILAEPALAQQMWNFRALIDSSLSHPAEHLSILAFRQIDRLTVRAKSIIDRNRVLADKFLRACPQVELTLPEHGTCVFPRIKDRDADRFFDLLHNRYDTDVVPGRFFEAPNHFRLGLGGDTDVLREGLERLQQALTELQSKQP